MDERTEVETVHQVTTVHQVACKHCGKVFRNNSEFGALQAIRAHLSSCPALKKPLRLVGPYRDVLVYVRNPRTRTDIQNLIETFDKQIGQPNFSFSRDEQQLMFIGYLMRIKETKGREKNFRFEIVIKSGRSG